MTTNETHIYKKLYDTVLGLRHTVTYYKTKNTIIFYVSIADYKFRLLVNFRKWRITLYLHDNCIYNTIIISHIKSINKDFNMEIIVK